MRDLEWTDLTTGQKALCVAASPLLIAILPAMLVLLGVASFVRCAGQLILCLYNTWCRSDA